MIGGEERMRALPDAAAELFASEFEHLLAVVLRRLELEWQYRHRLDPAEVDRRLLQYALEFGRLLKVVYRHRLFSALREESRWYAGVFAARGSGADAFALLLDSWIIAIQGVLKPPECNALAQPIQAIRNDLPVLIAQSQQRGSAAPGPAALLLVDALARGDVRSARQQISDTAARGTAPDRLIVEVMLPAMAEIGRRWELGEVEVFQEHLATEAIQSLLSGLPLMTTGVPPKNGWTALVTCAPGDEHSLIPLALAAYLEFRGWSVVNLGRSLPAGQIARAVTALSPRVLFLTFTTITRLDETLEVIELCRAASARCRIILGGRGAVAAKALMEGRGALVARDFDEGFRLAAEAATDA